jgi:hypothetical protein
MRKTISISFGILILAIYGQAFGQKAELQGNYLLRLHNINSNLIKLQNDILLICKDAPKCIKYRDIEQSKIIIRRIDQWNKRWETLNKQYDDLTKEVEMNYKGELPVTFSSQWADELEDYDKHQKYIIGEMYKLEQECQKLLQ